MSAMKDLVVSMMDLSGVELGEYREAHDPQSVEWHAANDEITRRLAYIPKHQR